jgi:NAD-dependent deacetylase
MESALDGSAHDPGNAALLRHVRERFQAAERICVFTGAGMSAESGVPTYRGQGGIWSEYRYQDYACQEAFERAPERVWEFHRKRRAAVAACLPHPGHVALERAGTQKPELRVITQNIDGMHQRVGQKNVIELHGSLWRVRCERCHIREENWDSAFPNIRHDCGAVLRPDITWFGDALNAQVFDDAAEWIAGCDVFIAVGTSAVVYPAAGLPALARESGAWLVEVNLESTPMSHLYHAHIPLKASEALTSICGESTG